MTRAPMSASIIVQYGPESTRVRSMTVVPCRGPGEEVFMVKTQWAGERIQTSGADLMLSLDSCLLALAL